MTGILIANWDAYTTEPRNLTYFDIARTFQNGVRKSIINEFETDIEFRVFAPPFTQPYDYFEYAESVYLLQISYRWRANYDDGSFLTGMITTNSYSRSPNTSPPRLPRPTLSNFGDLPEAVSGYGFGSFRQIVNIQWDEPGNLTTTTYPPITLFIPGTRIPNTVNNEIYIGAPVYQILSDYDNDPYLNPYSYSEGLSQTPVKLGFYRNAKKPNYFDLLKGYELDNRTIKNNPVIIPPESKTIYIQYYRQNKLEPIPSLASIDLMNYECELVAGQSLTLPIVDCVLGTLNTSDISVSNILTSSITEAGKYPLSYYFKEQLASIFSGWNSLFNPSNTPPPALINGNGVINSKTIRISGANNNFWNNRNVPTADLNFDISHPMFAIDNQRAYDWHIKPQSDGSYGDLVMNSPTVIETRLMVEQLIKALNALEYQNETPAIVGTGTINNPQTPARHKLDWYIKNSAGEKVTAIWKALGGDKYGTNELDNTKDRVTNLGFLVERIAKVLGIRFDDNGKIDVEKEKKIVRRVIDAKEQIDDTKIGVNCFGDEGTVVKRINNRFSNKGEIVSDQCVILQDIPDMIQEYFEQSNLALGIQESSAIEISQGKNKARYRNQLELLVELVNLASSGNEMIRSALVSSLISQSQSNEIIAGMGLPSVTKTIPIKIDKKVHQLPYKGIAAHRSLSQEIATCTYNVGIATGQLL